MSASSKKKLRKEQVAAEMTEKQLAQQKEDKKLKAYTISFVAIMALVVVIALGTLGFGIARDSGLLARSTTAVTVGETKLTNAEMNYYYIDGISSAYSSWYSEYAAYGTYMLPYMIQMNYGLDITSPLDQQYYDSTAGTTWADYFVDAAAQNAASTLGLYNKAKADGHTLTAEEQEAVTEELESWRTSAENNSMSLNKYLQNYYGSGADEASFTNYLNVTALADSYYTSYAESLKYEDADIRAYEAEHFNEFTSYTYNLHYVGVSNFLEGGTTSEDGETTTYTDAEKQAAEAAAKAAADQLALSDSLELFDSNVSLLPYNMESETPVTSTAYDRVAYGSVDNLLKDWVTADERVEGDMTVIPYTYSTIDDDGNQTTATGGYYVVYYVSRDENREKMNNVRHILIAFEDIEDDESGAGTYSDAEKKVAYDEAEALLNTWKAGEATEDSFAALVEENTDDTGSKYTGGLYEEIHKDSGYVENFKNWALAEHKAGDTGIVETEYGYHIMYFVGQTELTYRDAAIESTLKVLAINEWYGAIKEASTYTMGNTDYVLRSLTISPSST